MAEKPGNPFEAAKKDVSNAPITEKTSKKSKFKVPSLVKAVGLAAGLHGAAYVAPDIAERVEQYQEEARQEENRERIERNREEAVRRALAEIESGDLHFWEFIRDTDRADLEAAGMPVPRAEEVERNFHEVTERLIAEQQDYFELHTTEDVEYLRESLAIALEGYHYTAGMGESDVQTFFHDRGGPCGMISLAIVSVLDRAGYEGVGIRHYPAGEDGYGHMAPTIVFTDESGQEHEIDLVGGGAVAPGGIRMTPEEIVNRYAQDHDLLPREPGNTAEALSEGERRARGWGISFPISAEARPFEGSTPFYSPEIFGAYHTDEEGRIVDIEGRPLAEPMAEDGSDQDLRYRNLMIVARSFLDRNFDRHLTYSREEAPSDRIEFGVRQGLNENELTSLSMDIAGFEQLLQQEMTPVRRLEVLGAVVGLYRLASTEASLLHRTQMREFAEGKIAEYIRQAEEIMRPHMNDRAFLASLGSTEMGSASSLIMLGEMGQQILLNSYDNLHLPELLDAQMADTLTYLLLDEHTRAEALERATQLSTFNQFRLAVGLASLQLGPEVPGRYGADHGVIMDGDDALSRNYRAHRALFGELLERVRGGYHEGSTLSSPFHPAHERALRSLSELQSEIHTYAESHGYDEAWEVEITHYAIRQIREYSSTYALIDLMRPEEADEERRMNSFFQEAFRWLETHPRYDNEMFIRAMRSDLGRNRRP